MNSNFTTTFLFASLLLLAGCKGCQEAPTACECETERHIEGYATLNANNPMAVLSTYDHDNDFLADASCHARMILSFNWADSARSRTTEMPCIDHSFETVFGYFPVDISQVRMKQTIATPGSPSYYYWEIDISQAADFSNPQGTLYKITATYNNACSPPGDIQINMDIFYQIYDEAQHERGENDNCV